MARYGGDYGGHRHGIPGSLQGMGRGYGADFGYGPGQEHFRGGLHRAGGRSGAPGPTFRPARPNPYDRGQSRFAGEESRWYGRVYERYPVDESQLRYGWADRVDRGGYDLDYEPGYRSGSGMGRQAMQGRARTWQDSAREMCAADIMTANPEAVTANTPVADAARKMRELNVGIIPVVDDLKDRHLKGVITDRDIAVRVIADGKDGSTEVSQCMTDQVQSCRRDDPVRDLMHVMRTEQVRRIPITDEDGRLVGIVAQADLAVDYAGFDPDRKVDVEETVERISEPARPERARSGMRTRAR